MSEGSLHYQVKNEIADTLAHNKEVTDLELERPFGLTTSREHHRRQIQPDVTFRLRGCRIAVEVQGSQQTWEEIAERTTCYDELGIFVLWILLHKDNMLEGRLTQIAEWKQGVHALYSGLIYLWLKGETLLPVHLHLTLGSGNEGIAGALSLRKRVPWFLSPVQITALSPEIRGAEPGGRYLLPAAHLWNLPDMVREQAKNTTHHVLDVRKSIYEVRNGLEEIKGDRYNTEG